MQQDIKQTTSKTAIILGATGLTGSHLLQLLLHDERYDKIKLFSRSSAGIENPKIEEHLVDLFELEKHKENFTADQVYCCIGTTKKKTPDQEKYRKIDYGIPVAAAKLAHQNGIETFAVISSMGANPESSIFYSRTKGEMEEAVKEQGVPNTIIVRPSLIRGDRDESRFGEKVMGAIMSVVDFIMIGGLKKYRSIKAKDIAKAMLYLANQPSEQQIFNSYEVQKAANEL